MMGGKNDDWMGKSLISAKPKSERERKAVTGSSAMSIHHEQARRKGHGVSRSDTTWAKQFRGKWKAEVAK